MEDIELRGHIVICGWSETAKGIIKQIRADSGSKNRHIVLVDPNLDGPPLNDPFIYFVKGDPSDYETLDKAFIKTAETALILADWYE